MGSFHGGCRVRFIYNQSSVSPHTYDLLAQNLTAPISSDVMQLQQTYPTLISHTSIPSLDIVVIAIFQSSIGQRRRNNNSFQTQTDPMHALRAETTLPAPVSKRPALTQLIYRQRRQNMILAGEKWARDAARYRRESDSNYRTTPSSHN